MLVSPLSPVGSAGFCKIWPPTVVLAIADSPLSDYPEIRQFWIRSGKGWEIRSPHWKPWIRETALPPTIRTWCWQSAATQTDLLHLMWLGVASRVALRATPEHITYITFLMGRQRLALRAWHIYVRYAVNGPTDLRLLCLKKAPHHYDPVKSQVQTDGAIRTFIKRMLVQEDFLSHE